MALPPTSTITVPEIDVLKIGPIVLLMFLVVFVSDVTPVGGSKAQPSSSPTTSSNLPPPPPSSAAPLLPPSGGDTEDDEGMKHLQQVGIAETPTHTWTHTRPDYISTDYSGFIASNEQ